MKRVRPEYGEETTPSRQKENYSFLGHEIIKRKRIMKKAGIILLIFCLLFCCSACNTDSKPQDTLTAGKGTLSGASTQETDEEEKKAEKDTMDTKTLVTYFSCTGTTRKIAEYAAEILNADIYEIVPEDPYTEEDLAYYSGGRADQEQDDPLARPAIAGGVENIEKYDTILIGYPIWHGQAPRIISTFLESYDFTGRTILTFCTSHSSGIGSSADNLHSVSPDAVWLEGVRFSGETPKSDVETWLNEHELTAKSDGSTGSRELLGDDVIPGSSNPDHIQENTELYKFELSQEEMEQMNALDRGEKHDWY